MPKQSDVENVHTQKSKQEQALSPAYFLSVSVENFRCFKEKQTLDLSNGNGTPARWTIILGDNGHGKTTLLQVLAALQPTKTTRTKLDPSHQINNDEVVFTPKLDFTNGVKTPFNSWIFDLDMKAPRSFNACIYYNVKLNDANKGKTLPEFEFAIHQISSNQISYSVTAAQPELKQENIGGLVCYGYGATRRMTSGPLREGEEHDTTASLFSENARLINAQDWYLQADYAAHRSSSQKRERQREQIRAALIQILPDVQDLRITEPKDSTLAARVEVKTPFGWVPIRNLSLGYRTLIAWVVDLAARLFERYPRSKNPLAEPAVALVDEIDLHLHPRFQRVLMDYLTDIFPNTQFIATAHSPLVVQAASNANIALLRREDDHIVIENDVEAIKNWRIDQILTSDLFGLESARAPQFDHLLQEREQILSKARLTKNDKARLAELESQIGNLPTGETPDDIRAMDIIRRAAEQLSIK